MITRRPEDTVEPQGPTIDPLDQLLSMSDVYRMSPAEADTVKVTEIRAAVAWHVAHLPAYAAYCRQSVFDPSDLESVDDLARVPLLPSALFKRRDSALRTLSPTGDPDDVVETTSSGTQGSISIVPRDNVTLMRFFASVSSGVRDVLGIDDFAMPVHNLGPSPEEAAHLWIAYVLAGASVFFDSRNHVSGGHLRTRELVSELSASDTEAVIIGPPALILELCGSASLRMHPGSLVVSVGGWKKAGNKVIDREAFRATVGSALGLDADRIRDAYNMVELNSVVFECAHRSKHLAPWLHVTLRDARTLAPVDDGEPGILAYLDPTAQSYPAFVLSDDFGSVRRAVRCPCGLCTDVLQIERRINRLETRGCALKMNYTPSQERGAP